MCGRSWHTMKNIRAALSWKSVISVLLAIIGARIICSRGLRVSRPVRTTHLDPSIEIAMPQSGERQKKGKGRFRPAALFGTLTILAGVGGWMTFVSSNPGTPARPPFQTGGILVFVDDAHEKEVTINFTVNRYGYFAISVSPSTSTQQSGGMFLVVSSGSASITPQSPFPGDTTISNHNFTNKTHINSVALDDKGDFTVGGDGEGGFDNEQMRYVLDGYEGNSNVTAAVGDQYDGNLDSDLNDVLCGKLRNPISQSSGGVVLGELPLIGAPGTMTIISSGYVAPFNPVGAVTIDGDLSRLNQDAGSPVPAISNKTKWYEPRTQVVINVSYNENGDDICSPIQDDGVSSLPVRYQLSASNPATINSNSLRWKVAGAAQVGWNLADSAGQQLDATRLFISGLLLGAAASFLGIALDRAISRRGND